jgi:hypothetical protein
MNIYKYFYPECRSLHPLSLLLLLLLSLAFLPVRLPIK